MAAWRRVEQITPGVKESMHTVATIYYLKCPFSNQKLQGIQRNKKYDHIPGVKKKAGNTNCP